MINENEDASTDAEAAPTSTGAVAAAATLRKRVADDVIDLLLRRPLYAELKGDAKYIEEVVKVLSGERGVDFDNYCVTCGTITPWTLRKYAVLNSGGGSGYLGSNRYVQHPVTNIRAVNVVCLRRQHFYTYLLHVFGTVAQKIGQTPSMADIAFGELKGVPGIQKQDRKELGRALGLFAHDTPLGAFVYLRRVFERMISRAHDRHKEKCGTDLDGWGSMKMGERIRALAKELPPVVQSNYAVWGLLSKGIHELSDEDAETLFPLVKAVIFEMLGEEERHRQAAIQSEATRAALAAAVARYNPPAGTKED